ncbi:hypothetical protein FQN57_002003 [Myotisia sp. PD_48]|nr:hypothetical protein FQN57_002003 [Myotisia sp. PD_48]
MTSEPKRRAGLDYKRRQFGSAPFKSLDYSHRLNFYEIPPTAEITLEQFEQWAIDRLKVLSELEACSYRNKSPAETTAHIAPILKKLLPLNSNSSLGSADNDILKNERKKDHYSHFILRLAFASTQDLRQRFVRLETMLFKYRFQQDDAKEKREFIASLNLDLEMVSDQEKSELGEHLLAATPGVRFLEDESWYKVDWEKVPELVERRATLIRRGKAYVASREQLSLILAEYTARLTAAMEHTSRELPRLDEDDRLHPILQHLSKNFGTSDSAYGEGEGEVDGAAITAASIDSLSVHFPLCMRNLHMNLRKNAHLKHFGRLQYTLFLKGIGLSLEDALIFWRRSFRNITEDEFNSRYKYNVRHAYGDVGGDVNRRGRGYPPYSCQKILTDSAQGAGQTHGCPYRHFSVDNLISLLETTGVTDRETLRGVRDDVSRSRFHIACNRVFEHVHKTELQKVKDEGTMPPAQLDTIVHPNTYFKRSYMLKQLKDGPVTDVEMT